MTIFQCISCPRLKAGQPWKSSAQKPWLCEACAAKSLSSKLVVPSSNPDKLILRLKGVKR